MKKIQVSSVPMNTNVEVLFVNGNLISKAIRAQIAITKIHNAILDNGNIRPMTVTVKDENGNAIVDKDGFEKQEPMLDKNNNPVINYSSHRLDGADVEALDKYVVPFLKELTDAFEG